MQVEDVFWAVIEDLQLAAHPVDLELSLAKPSLQPRTNSAQQALAQLRAQQAQALLQAQAQAQAQAQGLPKRESSDMEENKLPV
jgi:hypothetical protein